MRRVGPWRSSCSCMPRWRDASSWPTSSSSCTGGWFTIMIAGLACSVMIAWRNSTRIKDSFTEFKRLGDWLGVISDIKADREIPKYASNVIYFSHSPDAKHSGKQATVLHRQQAAEARRPLLDTKDGIHRRARHSRILRLNPDCRNPYTAYTYALATGCSRRCRSIYGRL